MQVGWTVVNGQDVILAKALRPCALKQTHGKQSGPLQWELQNSRNVTLKKINLLPPRVEAFPEPALVNAYVERSVREESFPCSC